MRDGVKCVRVYVFTISPTQDSDALLPEALFSVKTPTQVRWRNTAEMSSPCCQGRLRSRLLGSFMVQRRHVFLRVSERERAGKSQIGKSFIKNENGLV